MKTKLFITIATTIIIAGTVAAQTNTFPATGAAGIGTVSPNASSLLDISSTTKGMLVPRMTKAQRDAIATPTTGLLIYQTNSTPGFYYYTGTAWTALKPSNAGKKLSNLTAPTAINVELLPDTNNTIDLGSSSQAWKNIYASGSYFIGSNKVINVSGNENTFIGLTGNTTNTGSSNTATGRYALNANTTGYYNTATGAYALNSNTTGYQNTATGRMALLGNTTGYWNTATGMVALYANTTGNKNTATGQSALQSNTTASENTANGVSALASQSYNPGPAWVSANTAFGFEALYANQPTSTGDGINNTAVGHSALRNNTTGYFNTVNGNAALYSNTTGYWNTAMGRSALHQNTSGYDNTATGGQALFNNSTGNLNTAMGRSALYNNTTGGDNTAIGGLALANNTIGNNNTATGFDALVNNTSGHANTANGFLALYSNTTGVQNTSIGNEALYYSTGSFNTAVGGSAGNNNGTAPSNFTAIGFAAGHLGNNSNTIEIGNGSVSWIGGNVGWSLYSDKRIKDNIQNNVPGLSFISKLNPVTYNLNIHKQHEICGINDTNEWEGKYDIEKITQTGFLAQEVEQAAQECNYDFNGVQAPTGNAKLYSIQYASFVMPLVKAVQELDKTNAELKNKIAAIERVLSPEQRIQLSNNNSASQGKVILFQNNPNPFNQTTVIRYELSEEHNRGVIIVRDLSGSMIKSIAVSSIGKGQVTVSANEFSQGTYTYSLEVDGESVDTKLMVITK